MRSVSARRGDKSCPFVSLPLRLPFFVSSAFFSLSRLSLLGFGHLWFSFTVVHWHAPTNHVLSPTQTLVDGKVPQRFSPFRRYLLLIIFCFAQFLDAFNNSALFSAIPSLENSLGITESQSTWIISAFQLTFASFPGCVERSHKRCLQSK